MTIDMELTWSGRIEVTPEYDGEVFDASEEIEKVFTATMRELVLLNVPDPSVTGSVQTGEFEVTCLVSEISLVDAITVLDPTVRAALHAAEVATPEWGGRPRITRFSAIDSPSDETEEKRAEDAPVPA